MYLRELLSIDFVKKENFEETIKMYDSATRDFFNDEGNSAQVDKIIRTLLKFEEESERGNINLEYLKQIDIQFFEAFLLYMKLLFNQKILEMVKQCVNLDNIQNYITNCEYRAYEVSVTEILHEIEGFLTIDHVLFPCLTVQFGGFITLPDTEVNELGEIVSVYMPFNDFRLLSNTDTDVLYYMLNTIHQGQN